jgi:CHAD domain-containing protein
MPSAPVVAVEIERKFEPGPGFRLPDLSGLPGVVAVAAPRVHELDATYFDTADLRLIANKITLRRRTGGDDAGWHLKRPRAGGDRDELQLPLGRTTRTVPRALRATVEVHLRGAKLGPVVRLATTRTVHHLLGSGGAVLAEVAQDEVTATVPPAAGGRAGDGAGDAERVSTWSELEVELVTGGHDLLEAVVQRVLDAGAPVSASASKLSRALGDRLPRRRPELPAGIAPGSAAAVLLAHLGEHVARLKRNDPLVRDDRPDAVHQMRVATRRLRSALATYRPLLDREITDPLRDELKWLGEVLGGARDAEVIRDTLAGQIAEQQRRLPELVLGPVGERIATSLGGRYRAAHDQVLATLDGVRYFALLDALDRLLADPPLAPSARAASAQAGPARPASIRAGADAALLPLVAHTFRRLRRAVEAAEQGSTDPRHDGARHDELLHEVRKAAKRARYAGESLVPTHGEAAEKWAARMEAIQECLGEHQDSVVIRAELVALAATAHAAGEDTFTYGRLHALEEARADATESDFDAAWAAARRKSLQRWLRHPG